MKGTRTSTGVFILVLLAAVGFALVYIPPQIVEQYRRIESWGQGWVIAYFCVVGLGAAILLSLSSWMVARVYRATYRKRRRNEQRRKNPSELGVGEKSAEIQTNLDSIFQLQDDPVVAADIKKHLEPMLKDFEEKRETQELEIVVFGTISSGKSSLLNALAGRDVFQTDPKGGTTVTRNEIPWPGFDRVTLVDTPGLGEVDGVERAAVAASAAQDADLVLLVVDGPLRASEFLLLEQLGQMEKRIIVCLNKQDWYDARDRAALLGQIAEQLKSIIAADDIVGVQSQTAKRTRIRVLPDGSEREEVVEAPPDISALADRMLIVLQRDGSNLLLANLLLQSRGLVTEARRRVQESLDKQAWSMIDRYAWGAGGAAALSPLPLLDIAAGGAITTKMVLDLAKVYRQDIDLDAAVKLLGQLGKNLIAILGVSAATPIVVSAIATLLRAVPGAGTLAGGVLQGLVQALITRWIGAVFIEYFKNEMRTTPAGLAEVAREQWKKLTTVQELRHLLQTARKALSHDD
jgi:small GTP-binding protein